MDKHRFSHTCFIFVLLLQNKSHKFNNEKTTTTGEKSKMVFYTSTNEDNK